MTASKRAITVVAGGLALALGATGCGVGTGGADGGSSPDSLSVMTQWTAATPEGEAFNRAVEAFTEDTGIKVEVQEGVDALDDAYETALAAGQEPDVVALNLFDKTTGWLANDATVEVTEYVDKWGLRDKIEPAAIKEWTDAEGRVQGFPYAGFSWPVWYNSKLLAKAGIDAPPTTIDELKAAAGALRDAGIGPMAVGGSDWTGQKLFMQIAQQYMDTERAETLFREGGYCDNPEAMQGIELFVELRDAGVFVDDVQGFNADLMHTSFYTGDVAMMPAGSWAFADTPKDIVDSVVLGGFPTPSGGQYTKPTAYRGFTATGFWISPNGADKLDTVRQFVTSFYEDEVVADFVSSGNLVPAVKLADSGAAQNPLLETALTTLSDEVDFAVMPDIYLPGPVTAPATQATAAAFGDGVSAEDICAGLDQAYGL